ncbi:hypothetical protein [Thiosulfativibrio zosterae]|uniref:Uncharacterized protein n=1 Tax=Thiosulfativibrio zosterae TaxID=2675053 RepID=A0A6F8PPE1_9GAMM|nr:hypothetical protein [Thiosulfativibrio zosterae]BBP43991.1 hypothetical protein THMIRHAT_17370 [Thiosulfativibrio zosterae]
MANALDSIDPNDLDSIDALLDEAEIESIVESKPAPELPEEEPEAFSELDSLEDDPTDSLLDDLESELSATEELADVPDIPVEIAKPAPVKEVEAPPVVEKPPAPITDNDSQSFLEKRAAASAAQQNNSELTVAEMDGLKKLIIIFGSVLSTLAIIGIAMGIWAAIAAGKGLDEESSKMLEDIKVGTQQNTQKASESSNLMKGVEKKIDALSFQLEQINNDLNQLDHLAKSPAPMELNLTQEATHADPHAPANGHADPHVTNTHGNTHAAPVKVQPMAYQAAPVAPVVMAQPDPEVGEKLSKVSAQIVTAQARIAEVNKRLKDMQAQYGSLATSVKTVEKEVIAAKVEKAKEKALAKAEAEALEAEKAPKRSNAYQYTVPGFDYNNNRDGSYP